MIYVTGDLHADLERFKCKAIKKLKKGDTLIVCGDFGFVWDGSKKEQKLLKWLGKRRYQILFVEGTHDNLTLLENYPKEIFCGGMARRISGRCWQLLRGEIYTIEGNRFFTFGGGESNDMDTREEGKTWWKQELPDMQEIAHAWEILSAQEYQVDYIITHSPSEIVNQFLNMDGSHTNQLGTFLNELSSKATYQKWYFGCCHLDKVIPPKHYAVYQNLLPIEQKNP